MKILALLTIFSICFPIFALASLKSYRNMLACAFGANKRKIGDRAEFISFGSVGSNVFFYLFTEENPNGQQIYLNNLDSLKTGKFNTQRHTKIVTHGYDNSYESDACMKPKQAFLKHGKHNVILIDWWKMQSILGVPIPYNMLFDDVARVGNHVAKLISFLESQGLDANTTTLIGHSLGAHVMGIAGDKAKNKVNHIIGLDPALPMFETVDADARLSIEDAVTVVVIHTNQGACGMSDAVGHYDFYPNGGSMQPGCDKNTCAHSRAYELYAESIISDVGFYGRHCHDVDALEKRNCTGEIVEMNEYLREQNAKQGIYYFETRGAYPFALGKAEFMNMIEDYEMSKDEL